MHRKLFAAIIVSIAALALSACGPEDSNSNGGGAGAGGQSGPQKLTVGITGLVSNAPLYIAEQKGWFDEAGLDVTIKVMGGGAHVVPSLSSGELQVGSSNLISIMQAWNEGIKLPSVGVTNVAAASLDDTKHLSSAILVKDDSSAKTAADLEGKTVAVNTLNSLGDLTIKASVEKAGGDPSTVKFTEVPIPSMIGAIEENRVDAIWTVEPFLTAGTKAGLKPISYNFEEAMLGLPLGTYNVTEKFAKDNPEAVASFTDVMVRAADYANEHEDEVRAIVPTYTKISPEVAETMALPVFAGRLDAQTVRDFAQMSVRYGLLNEAPNADEVFGGIYEK